MSFTAKVKKTGQLFLAGGETGPDGILYDAFIPIRPDLKYSGNLIDRIPGNLPWVEFSTAEWAVFDSDEIEEFPVELRFLQLRRES